MSRLILNSNSLVRSLAVTSITLALAGCTVTSEGPQGDTDNATGGQESDTSDSGVDTGSESGGDPVPGGPSPNGIELPDDFADWRALGVANRTDNGSIRIITGNDIAIEAARAGNTNPWPDGTMLADMVWSAAENPEWADMLGAGDFGALVLMVKDSDAYEEDGGWAYGQWTTDELLPATDADFDRDCVQCHLDEAPDNDFVFTRVGPLPDFATIAAAPPSPNGVALPAAFPDWRILGVADRTDNGTIRLITGNDIAVDAARSGDTNPWPEGTMIADLVWADSTNPDWADVNVPGAFGAFAFMVKDTALYAADGGWGYGLWASDALTPGDDGFDADCIMCHTVEVPDLDFVFTNVAPIPSL